MLRRAVWWMLLLLPMAAGAQEVPVPETPTVNGVLFYSPTCPHCREVMTETLPPILGRYGDALRIVSVNTATPGGQELYRAVIETLAVPRERTGVPALLLGDRLLVGSWEVPNLLPGIADSALAATGIDWPPVPLVRRALAAQGVISEADVAIAPEPDPELAGGDTAVATESSAPEATPGAEAEPAPRTEPASETGAASETDSAPGNEAGPGKEAASEMEPAPETKLAPEPEAGPGTAGAGRETVADTGAEPAATEPVATEPAPPTEADAGGAADGGATEEESDSALSPAVAGAIQADGRTALAHELSIRERVMLDPAGNGFAIAVLILMLVALGLVAADLAGQIRIPAPPPWAIPLLSLVGIGVAAYLAFVEVTGAEAVCGPVGHCNVVQQSPYARVLGVPVGVLGVFGYAALLAVWAAGRLVGAWAPAARAAVWWMALGATGFSLYLTFLEPFVIGASCAWCLSSAVATTLILLAATPERFARDRVRGSPTPRPSVSH